MRTMLWVTGLGACLLLAMTTAADEDGSHGDNGPKRPGRDWSMYTPTKNGDRFATVDACAEIGLNYCSECENPYMLCYDCYGGSVIYPDNRGCKDCDTANCYECEWNEDGVTTRCLECYNHYMLAADGSCAECGTNCGECEADAAGTQTCTECYDRSMLSQLDPTNCISCGSRCETCSLAVDDTVTCSKCEEGFYVNANGKCEACPSNCLSCSKPDTTKLCSACAGNYQVSTDQTKCLPCGFGCSACSGQSETDTTKAKCTSCLDNYYFETGSDQCTVCMANCISCSEAGKCDECEARYYLADDAGSSCSPCEWKCQTCSDGLTCDECFVGYTSKAAESITCDSCPANCLSCTVIQSASGQCATCASGYYKDSSSTCKKCSANCDVCSSTACTNCVTGYNLADGNCYECPLHCLDDTVSCSYNTTVNKASCVVCEVEWAINAAETTCIGCGAGCAGYCVYNDTLLASECECSTGTVDTATGIYQFRGTCTGATLPYACLEGFYYDEAGTNNNGAPACEDCAIQGCVHCNATSTSIVCVDCDVNGYVTAPNAGACDACSNIHSRCLTCSDASTCTSCSSGYSIDTGTCKACGSLCDSCTFSGSPSVSTCSVCKTNAVKDPDVAANCKACISPCTSCSVGTDGNTVCDSNGCPSGYVFNNGACDLCPENCLACEFDASLQLVCTDGQCASYYGRLQDGLCYLCPDRCVTCSISTAVDAEDKLLCDSCESKYTRNDQLCAPCPSNCDTCTEADGTVSGATSRLYYYLASDATCPRCPSNCQKCSATSCSVCDDGFGLAADRKSCIACSQLTTVDNCAMCDSARTDGTASCFKCAYGYKLSDDWSYCNLTTTLGTQCSKQEDHYPECLTCDANSGRVLLLDDAEFKYPKECVFECYKCGMFDEEGYMIAGGTDEQCNPKENANFTMVEPCYDGFCAVFVKMIDGSRDLAARGCHRNSTCSDTGKDSDTENCVGDKQNDLCMKCCTGDLCNTDFYSAGAAIQTSIMLVACAFVYAIFF